MVERESVDPWGFMMGLFPFSVRRLARRRRRGVLVALALATVAVGIAIPVTANLTGSDFEIDDGNLEVDAGGTEDTDWASPAPNLALGVDESQSASDNSYKGGAKHDTPCPPAETGSIPPNKDDLTRLYASQEMVGEDVFLYMAWERFLDKDSTASAHMGFEFNQGSTDCGPKSDNVVRTPGDILILYDLEGGGKPVFELLTWVTSANDINGAADCKAANALPCWGQGQVLGSNVADGEINRTAPITDPIDEDGGLTADRDLNFRHMFGEGAVNLTDAGVFGADDCHGFGSATLGSRSSGNSFVSTQKDFVGPVPVDLQNCGKIVIKKETTPNGATETFGYTAESPLDPGTFNLQDGGTQELNDVQPGSYDITESTLPAGWDLSSVTCVENGASETSDKLDQNGKLIGVTIDLAPTETVTCTFNNTKRGKIIVEKQTVPDGLTDSFGFTQGTGLPSGTFNLTDGGQQEFANLVAGTYEVTEDAAPGFALTSITCDDSNSGRVPNTRTARFVVAAGETVKCTFTNTQTHVVIVLVCHQNTNTLAKSDVTYDLGGPEETVLESLAHDSVSDEAEDALCKTGGAAFGGKGHVAASLRVNISNKAHP